MGLRKLIYISLKLAEIASAEIMPRYRKCKADIKPDRTRVTDADKAAEKVIREEVTRMLPEASILGEEFDTVGNPRKGLCVTIDPIDGTEDFILQLGRFSTLIGILEDGEPIVGVVSLPVLGETIYAAKGMGCWLLEEGMTQRRLSVKEVPIKEATILTTGTKEVLQYSKVLSVLANSAFNLRFVSDAPQHMTVCKGLAQAALDIDGGMKSWDIAPIVVCVEEAGGKATSITGERKDIVFDSSLVTSCGGQIHDQIVKKLNS